MKLLKIASLCFVLTFFSPKVFTQTTYDVPRPGDEAVFENFATHDVKLWKDYREYINHPTFSRYGQAVGRLIVQYSPSNRAGTENFYCTATILTEHLVITNYHCVYPSVETQQTTLTLTGAALEMDFLEGSGSNKRFVLQTTPLVDFDEKLDYAIMTFIRESPADQYPPIPLNFRDSLPLVGEPLFMVHHSRGEHKRITFEDCSRVSRIIPGQIETPSGGYRNYIPDTDIPHFCDSLGGSSGSLVIAQSDGAIVGLHFSGTSNSLAESQRVNLFIDFQDILQNSTKLREATQDVMSGSAGLFLNTSLVRGTRLEAEFFDKVLPKIDQSFDRPLDFEEDARSACLLRDLGKGTRLEWSDLNSCN